MRHLVLRACRHRIVDTADFHRGTEFAHDADDPITPEARRRRENNQHELNTVARMPREQQSRRGST